jgi:ABC-type sugar transport system permease subunit
VVGCPASLRFAAEQPYFLYEECAILNYQTIKTSPYVSKRGFGSKRKGTLVVLLGPAIILLLSITIYPFAYLLYNSFYNYNLMNPTLKRFIGFDNYVMMFHDPLVMQGLYNTLIFAACSVAIQMVFGLLFALLFDSKLRGMQVATMLFLIPMTITPIVGALTWKYLLTPPFGWLNYYLMKFHLISEPIVWLGQGSTAMFSLIVFNAWQWTPFVTLILLAGLKSQPGDLLEAASIDGANRFQVFHKITLPFLKRFLLIALILRVIDAFKEFPGVFGLTGGGPGQSTVLMTLVVYRKALQSYQIGYTAAIGFLFLVLLTIITAPMLKRLQKEISD